MNAPAPDLVLAGFSLWVFAYQYPDAADYANGNWWMVRMRTEADQAAVEAQGALLHASDLTSFLEDLEPLAATMQGRASLVTMENTLRIDVEAHEQGQITAAIVITPDPLHQLHSFIFDIGRSDLPPLLTACKAILTRFPVKGARTLGK